MDVVYFLKLRTRFIRQFHANARHPFDETKRLIEAEEPPYEPPYFDPDVDGPEPPFLEEWMDAEMSLHVLGIASVSLLSDTLKIYFKTLEREIGFKPTPEVLSKVFRAEGFLAGYKVVLAEVLGTDWSDCPVDFDILEQVVLARNRGQHGSHIDSFRVAHDERTIAKHPRLFFISEQDKESLESGEDGQRLRWFGPEIEVSSQDLHRAIDEVDKLADWIGGREEQVWEWRQARRKSKAGT
jgi:hypothetical protein